LKGHVETVDCLVLGAGVIGLAAARALARAGFETLVVESSPSIGGGISSRNSEVIHAGIYYPRGSLKAELCLRGRALLYEYCAKRGIAHRRCGKLIVATQQAQEAALQRIEDGARRNGVDDLRLLSRRDAIDLEPALDCCAAILSPSTGIIDSHGLMLALLGEAEDAGATVALHSPADRLVLGPAGTDLYLAAEAQPSVRARWTVNCTGLGAPALARRMEGFPATQIPVARYAKGSYFSLSGRAPFSRLIYPVPEVGGLGVHLTLDIAGQARFGPDVEWIDAPDYSVDAGRAGHFRERIRSYWPGLGDAALTPAYAGVRPKISGPDEPAADFRIDGPEQHGTPGIVQLFGIESPGLTASLSIAERILAIVQA